MKTVRHLIYREIILATAFVSLAFLLLFMFFDFIDQLEDVRTYGAQGYTLARALLYVVLLLPSRLYELLPISILIGAIYVMARMASNSEYTILRTSGLEPWRALRLMLGLGAAFVVFTFAIGDYAAPAASQAAQTLQARYTGGITVGTTGAWMRDHQGDRTYAINVASLASDGTMHGVRIFAFDRTDGRPLFAAEAASGTFARDGWDLRDVTERNFDAMDANIPAITTEQRAQWLWATPISSDMVAAALLNPRRMQSMELLRYIHHLQANDQNAQSYELEFWRKLFYPLGCLVMMMLALPFAYLHFRSGNLVGHVFIGVLFGVSFFLLNNVLGFVGNLHNWIPWLTAAVPGLLYALLSLALFGHLALRRR